VQPLSPAHINKSRIRDNDFEVVSKSGAYASLELASMQSMVLEWTYQVDAGRCGTRAG
jgi:hypothetical protein